MGNIILKWLKKISIIRLSRFQRTCFIKIFDTLYKMITTPSYKEKVAYAMIAETGAGKTEAYFLPVIASMLLGKISNKFNLKLIAIYPRIALMDDQFRRFIMYLYELNKLTKENKIVIGIDNTYIPRNEKVLREKYEEYEYRIAWNINKGLIFKRIRCPVICKIKEGLEYECQSSLKYDPNQRFIMCSSDHKLYARVFKEHTYRKDTDIVILSPNILLQRLPEKSFIRNIIDESDILVVVLDDCHLYYGLSGSHMSLAIRRLLRLISSLNKKILLLGISATMASPEIFLKELTGLNISEILQPEEDEMERKAVEYYILIMPETVSMKRVKLHKESEEEFEEELKPIKPLSTMIQTIMCVMHNMKRTPLKYKGIGFVDSIDVLHRWYYYMKNAEEDLRLFEYRVKLNPKDFNCNMCSRGPYIDCPIYKVGECWWFAKFDKYIYRSGEPLTFRIYYSKRREKLDKEDCILTTSALEVGYDDPKLITFFQYKGPRSLISFAQRKGRVARSPTDRPVNVLVLSPYSRRDNFIFNNDDYLLNSKFNELPLNYENYYIQRSHARASILDYMGYFSSEILGPPITYEQEFSSEHRKLLKNIL
ncbi:MAG TPA: DEAD/DEAH box helicase, partial [Thermoprotei archaeon]|nr:DEAD/DEAH box helicase [Thermoprotei archaeon]